MSQPDPAANPAPAQLAEALAGIQDVAGRISGLLAVPAESASADHRIRVSADASPRVIAVELRVQPGAVGSGWPPAGPNGAGSTAAGSNSAGSISAAAIAEHIVAALTGASAAAQEGFAALMPEAASASGLPEPSAALRDRAAELASREFAGADERGQVRAQVAGLGARVVLDIPAELLDIAELPSTGPRVAQAVNAALAAAVAERSRLSGAADIGQKLDAIVAGVTERLDQSLARLDEISRGLDQLG
ncbi:MAG: hypothetical protein LBQ06_04765 [Frankiaceae bacterium]|jgi:hypothetical protein|nr:hypothetical protein [Frankiaceae bacterium]